MLPKIKLEILVEDTQLEAVLTALAETARTGKIGDGKIFVTTIDALCRIRTGETGPAALE